MRGLAAKVTTKVGSLLKEISELEDSDDAEVQVWQCAVWTVLEVHKSSHLHRPQKC